MKFKVEVGDLYWEVCGEVRLVFEVPCESNSFHRLRLQSCLMRLAQTAQFSTGRPELFAIYIHLSR